MGETLLFLAFCAVIWFLVGYSVVFDDLAGFWPKKGDKAGKFSPTKTADEEVALPKTAEEVRALQQEMAEQKALEEQAVLKEQAAIEAEAQSGEKLTAKTALKQRLDGIKTMADLSHIKDDLRIKPDISTKKPAKKQGNLIAAEKSTVRADAVGGGDLQALRGGVGIRDPKRRKESEQDVLNALREVKNVRKTNK